MTTVHSSQCLLTAYYVPGSVQTTGDPKVHLTWSLPSRNPQMVPWLSEVFLAVTPSKTIILFCDQMHTHTGEGNGTPL